MKTIRSLLVNVALVLVLVLPVAAQAPAPGVWSTGFTLRNMSGGSSTPFAIDFYNASGVSVVRYEATLPPSSSVFLYSGNIDGLPEETTARVGSNTQVAVVANIASAYPDKTESAYVGMRYWFDTSSELFVPLVVKNYYGNSSAIRVMNTSYYGACVRVRYYRLGESTPTYTEYRTLSGDAGYTFLQEDMQQLGVSFIGSARIDSVDYHSYPQCTGGWDGRVLAGLTHISIDPGPIVGNPFPWRLHSVHNPVKEGDHLAYLPVLCNDYYGNISAVSVMNMGALGQWVRMTFSGSNHTEKYIQPRSSELWYVPNEGPPINWLGTGTAECIEYQGGPVTTNCEIVATVNQINEDHGNFASFNGFTSASGQRISHLPVVVKDYTSDDLTSTITCMNVDEGWVLVCLKLDGLQVRCQYIYAGNSYSWYLGNQEWVTSGYNGSGYAYAYYPSEKIICLVQQNADSPSEDGDWLTTYNGVPSWD